MVRFTRLACGVLFLQVAVFAATIYSENGPFAGSNVLGDGGFIVLMAGWNSPIPYSNVSISAELGQVNGPVTISAFLTTQIGPGTTTAEQIAASTAQPASSAETDVLFSGLTLPSGQVYLTLSVPAGETGFWGFTNNSNLVTAAGVVPGPVGLASTSICGSQDLAYGPASTFCLGSAPNPANSSIFTVTGDAVGAPEPAPLLMLAGGLAVIVGFRWASNRRTAGI